MSLVQIMEVIPIHKKYFLIKFFSPKIAKKSSPGQFIHIYINNSTSLRRPFSICSVEKSCIYILFKIVGKGTYLLSSKSALEYIDVLGPLGRGFDYKRDYANLEPIFLGGGVGVAPLIFLSQKIKKGIFIAGSRTKKDVFIKKVFNPAGIKIFITTEDGSKGFKGKATDFLKTYLENNKYKKFIIFACGPWGMYEELSRISRIYPQIEIQVSLERFMGCGIGACCACSIDTYEGVKKVCKDGPVFNLKVLKIGGRLCRNHSSL